MRCRPPAQPELGVEGADEDVGHIERSARALLEERFELVAVASPPTGGITAEQERSHGPVWPSWRSPCCANSDKDADRDLDAKAAALLHSIVTGHALIDGNKRLGWVAVRLFYRLNDRDLHAPIDDAFDLVAAIADGSLRDVASTAARLRAWSSELDSAR